MQIAELMLTTVLSASYFPAIGVKPYVRKNLKG